MLSYRSVGRLSSMLVGCFVCQQAVLCACRFLRCQRVELYNSILIACFCDDYLLHFGFVTKW